MIAFGEQMAFKGNMVFLQSSGIQKGVFHGDGRIGYGMPQESGRSILGYMLFQRPESPFFPWLFTAGYIHDRRAVSEFPGSYHRIAEYGGVGLVFTRLYRKGGEKIRVVPINGKAGCQMASCRKAQNGYLIWEDGPFLGPSLFPDKGYRGGYLLQRLHMGDFFWCYRIFQDEDLIASGEKRHSRRIEFPPAEKFIAASGADH